MCEFILETIKNALLFLGGVLIFVILAASVFGAFIGLFRWIAGEGCAWWVPVSCLAILVIIGGFVAYEDGEW